MMFATRNALFAHMIALTPMSGCGGEADAANRGANVRSSDASADRTHVGHAGNGGVGGERGGLGGAAPDGGVGGAGFDAGVAATGGGAGGRRSAEGGDDADASLSCWDQLAAWSTFVQAHRACSVDSECTYYVRVIDPSELAGDCAGGGGLQVAIRRDAVTQAESFAADYRAAHCWDAWGELRADARALGAGCSSFSGFCVEEDEECYSAPEAGPDDDALDTGTPTDAASD